MYLIMLLDIFFKTCYNIPKMYILSGTIIQFSYKLISKYKKFIHFIPVYKQHYGTNDNMIDWKYSNITLLAVLHPCSVTFMGLWIESNHLELIFVMTIGSKHKKSMNK